jgi:hypothetical protein
MAASCLCPEHAAPGGAGAFFGRNGQKVQTAGTRHLFTKRENVFVSDGFSHEQSLILEEEEKRCLSRGAPTPALSISLTALKH